MACSAISADAFVFELEKLLRRDSLLRDPHLLRMTTPDFCIPARHLITHPFVRQFGITEDLLLSAAAKSSHLSVNEAAKSIRIDLAAKRTTVMIRDLPLDMHLHEITTLLAGFPEFYTNVLVPETDAREEGTEKVNADGLAKTPTSDGYVKSKQADGQSINGRQSIEASTSASSGKSDNWSPSLSDDEIHGLMDGEVERPSSVDHLEDNCVEQVCKEEDETPIEETNLETQESQPYVQNDASPVVSDMCVSSPNAVLAGKIIQIRKDVGGCWFITLITEDLARNLAVWLWTETLRGECLRVGIKSSSTLCNVVFSYGFPYIIQPRTIVQKMRLPTTKIYHERLDGGVPSADSLSGNTADGQPVCRSDTTKEFVNGDNMTKGCCDCCNDIYDSTSQNDEKPGQAIATTAVNPVVSRHHFDGRLRHSRHNDSDDQHDNVYPGSYYLPSAQSYYHIDSYQRNIPSDERYYTGMPTVVPLNNTTSVASDQQSFAVNRENAEMIMQPHFPLDHQQLPCSMCTACCCSGMPMSHTSEQSCNGYGDESSMDNRLGCEAEGYGLVTSTGGHRHFEPSYDMFGSSGADECCKTAIVDYSQHRACYDQWENAAYYGMAYPYNNLPYCDVNTMYCDYYKSDMGSHYHVRDNINGHTDRDCVEGSRLPTIYSGPRKRGQGDWGGERRRQQYPINRDKVLRENPRRFHWRRDAERYTARDGHDYETHFIPRKMSRRRSYVGTGRREGDRDDLRTLEKTSANLQSVKEFPALSQASVKSPSNTKSDKPGLANGVVPRRASYIRPASNGYGDRTTPTADVSKYDAQMQARGGRINNMSVRKREWTLRDVWLNQGGKPSVSLLQKKETKGADHEMSTFPEEQTTGKRAGKQQVQNKSKREERIKTAELSNDATIICDQEQNADNCSSSSTECSTKDRCDDLEYIIDEKTSSSLQDTPSETVADL